MRLSRFIPRFSLRSLLLLSLLAASGAAFWRVREPWRLGRSFAPRGDGEPIEIGFEPSLEVARFTPDGKSVVTVTGYGTAKVWDLESGEQKLETVAHAVSPAADRTAISHKGQVIVSEQASNRGWRLPPYPVDPPDPASQISQYRFVDDGHTLVVVTHAGITCWNVDNETSLASIPFKSGYVEFSENCHYVYIFREQDNLGEYLPGKVWRIRDGKCLLTVNARQSAFSRDDRLFAGEQLDEKIHVYDVLEGKEASVLPTKWLYWLSFSPNGTLLSTGLQPQVSLWDWSSKRNVCTLGGPHSSTIMQCVFSPDGQRMASETRQISIWSVPDGDLLAQLNGNYLNGGVSRMSFSPDGNHFLAVETYGFNKVLIWRRHRPEWWWGVAWLPEFWLTLLFAGAFAWSVLRDRRELQKKTVAAPVVA